MQRRRCTQLVGRLRELKKECKDKGEAYCVRGANRVQHQSPVENTTTFSDRPWDTSFRHHPNHHQSSTSERSHFKTYLTYTSEESRHGEQHDLLGIDTRFSSPPQAKWTTAKEPPHIKHSQMSIDDRVDEETRPLLQGSDLATQSEMDIDKSVTHEAERGANQAHGNSWQDGHANFQQTLEGSQQSSEIHETSTGLGQHSEGKLYPEGRDSGPTTLIKKWIRALFPCAGRQRSNRPASEG